MKRVHVDLLAFLVTAALCAALLWALSGCATEANTVKQTGIVAGGAAVGSLFSPIGAAIGGGVAYLFGAASEPNDAVGKLGLFARAGNWLDHFILWALAGYLLLLWASPKSRDNLVAFFTSRMPFLDRLRAGLAALIPSPHSPPAALKQKQKRELKALKEPIA